MAAKEPASDPVLEPVAAWVLWDQRVAQVRQLALGIIEDALVGKGEDAARQLQIASLALDTLKKLPGG